MPIPVRLRVNNTPREHTIEPRVLLVHYLRDHCGLTGTHVGCETSICGACTVLVDGKAVKSCTMFAVQADGASVTTIEGLADERPAASRAAGLLGVPWRAVRVLHAGHDHGLGRLLGQNASPTRGEIQHGLRGNLCRCTGYSHIIDAVQHAAKAGAGSPKAGAKAEASRG